MAEDPLPKKRNWILIILILGALYLLSAVFANVATVFSAPANEITSGNIAVIPVKGVITGDGYQDWLGTRGLSSSKVVSMIEKAESNDRIKAIILEVNSPGGSAVASEEIAKAVERANKTTVAWIREVGASGAYWVSSAADHIVASEVSITGSIGVISSYLEFSEFLDDWNVTYQRMVSGKYKDLGSPYKELTDEERNILQGKLDRVHEYFIRQVSDYRNMTESQVRDFSEGLTYLGGEALEMGLVDEIGGKREATKYIEKKLNITAKTVSYQPRRTFWDVFSGVATSHGKAVGAGLGEEIKSTDEEFYIRT